MDAVPDSTTVEAHINYPNDIGLVHSDVKTLTKTARSLGEKVTSYVRATKKRLARVGASLKSNAKNKKQQTQKALREVLSYAADTVTQYTHVVQKISKKVHTFTPHQQQQYHRLTDYVETAKQILAQTEQKLNGETQIPDRIISLYDPEARPIRRGKLKKPNEFGRTSYLAQDELGLILTYELQKGYTGDKTRVVPIAKELKRVINSPPKKIAYDKGFYSSENVKALRKLKIKRISLPKVGCLTKREQHIMKHPKNKALYRFRCGIEATISMLKRQFSFGRPLVRGTQRVIQWIGFSIMSYTLWFMTGHNTQPDWPS